MAQSHQLLGQPRQHQARVADDRQQHLAKCLGLRRVEACGRRPVARQPELSEAHRAPGYSAPGAPTRARQCLGVSAAQADGRRTSTAVASSMSSVSAPMTSPPRAEGQLGAGLWARGSMAAAGVGDRVADRRRRELNGLHGVRLFRSVGGAWRHVARAGLRLSFPPVFFSGAEA